MIQITKKLTGRKYWRSLDQLYQTSEFQSWLQSEFPSVAEEQLDEPSRRNMLQLMAASFGLAGLTACRPVTHFLPNAKGIEEYIPSRAMFYNTAMTLGGNAVGLTVKTVDGRPVKIEGNPNHPLSLGKTKSFHQASVLSLYDPDRVLAVRNGDHDSTWEAFEAAAREQMAGAGTGAGVRFLSGFINSPSVASIRKAALAKYPAAKWIEYEPVLTCETAANTLPKHDYSTAEVVVALDSDFLGIDSTSPLSTKQYASKRGQVDNGGTMNRLYVVESQMSVTGGAADHRFRLKSSQIGAFASALLAAVQQSASPLKIVGQAAGGDQILAAMAKDLLANRGKGIVVAGPRQPAGVHAVVQQINQALGNNGAGVANLRGMTEQTRPQLEALRELSTEMANGQVSTLIITCWNPAYTAPADLEFAANLKKVANVFYLAQDMDETAQFAKWVIPAAHYLESWGDAVAADGTVSIQQPAIEPLWGGKTPAEFVAALTGFPERTAYDIVRNYWTAALGGDKAWRSALHSGLVPANAATASATGFSAVSNAPAAPSDSGSGYEVVFVPSYHTFDGRFANNGWLQEAPEPMTTLVWDNAALVSTADAKKLGVDRGDVISIERNGRKIEAPVIVQPGQCEGSITLSVGHGREHVGRVGKGSGVNAYAIRTTDAFGFGTGFNVSKTGRAYPLSTTQDHHSMQEPLTGNIRPVVREATVEEYRKEPHFAEEMVEHGKLQSLYGEYDYSKGQQWGMVIDLNACTGCNGCMVACQAENNIAVVGKDQVARGREMHWIRLDRYFVGEPENPRVASMPMMCVHCETAPCENVCPVAATVHSPEGLNDMVYNRCVGTRYCSNNCPYKVRRFNYLNWREDTTDVEKSVLNPDVTVRMRGIMEKCTYCVQRIQNTKIDLRAEGRRWIKDGDMQTACQQACPADAIVFGNLNDNDSQVSKLKNSPRNYALLAEINTKPRGTFLAKLRNPNPDLETHHG